MEEKKLTGYPSIDKPWLKYYSEEAIKASMPACTIYEMFINGNREYPHNIALNYYGRRISYGQVFNEIEIAARSFSTLGVKKGDVVVVCMVNTPEMVYITEDGIAQDSTQITDELAALCAEHVPTYMIPAEYRFVNELPRTPIGKVDFRALEKEAATTMEG